MKFYYIMMLVSVGLFAGCRTSNESAEPVVFSDEAMVFLEPGLRPEVLLFPDYLLMEGFELKQHGSIPHSSLVGAGLRTELSYKKSMDQFTDALDSNGWTTDKIELGKRSFRMLASNAGDTIEIRGVQGETITQIFILYRPQPVAESIKKL